MKLQGLECLMISCSRFHTIHECDRHTDRQTDTGRRLVPRLHIASRGGSGKDSTMMGKEIDRLID